MAATNIQAPKQRPKQGQRADFPRLLGGNLALDFVNTLDSPLRSAVEFLHTYDDVIDWAEHVSMVNTLQATALHAAAKQSSEIASALFREAIALRAVLYRIFLAQAHKAQVAHDDLNFLKQMYSTALSHAQLVPTKERFAWQWPIVDGGLDMLLWPIVRSAVDLLCSTNVQRIKECPGADDCGGLFLDTSKNGSRQWCSMEGCGSRVKMRRQYARKHSS
jgi:predicted RNA-binding Zn ribbon-like protein